MNIVANKKESTNGARSEQGSVIRLNKDASAVLRSLIEKANKKDFGKRIRADQVINKALSLVRPEHLQELQQSSMSNVDRLEALYRKQAEKKKSLTKDDFYGQLLAGKLQIDEHTINVQK